MRIIHVCGNFAYEISEKKGTFFSRFESGKSTFCKNERLLFLLNWLVKIKKNAKM